MDCIHINLLQWVESVSIASGKWSTPYKIIILLALDFISTILRPLMTKLKKKKFSVVSESREQQSPVAPPTCGGAQTHIRHETPPFLKGMVPNEVRQTQHKVWYVAKEPAHFLSSFIYLFINFFIMFISFWSLFWLAVQILKWSIFVFNFIYIFGCSVTSLQVKEVWNVSSQTYFSWVTLIIFRLAKDPHSALIFFSFSFFSWKPKIDYFAFKLDKLLSLYVSKVFILCKEKKFSILHKPSLPWDNCGFFFLSSFTFSLFAWSANKSKK